jgi:hypothetical protein
MADEPQVEAIRERVARAVQAAGDDLRRLALPEEVDQAAELHGVIQRLMEELDDALTALELVERRQAPSS